MRRRRRRRREEDGHACTVVVVVLVILVSSCIFNASVLGWHSAEQNVLSIKTNLDLCGRRPFAFFVDDTFVVQEEEEEEEEDETKAMGLCCESATHTNLSTTDQTALLHNRQKRGNNHNGSFFRPTGKTGEINT